MFKYSLNKYKQIIIYETLVYFSECIFLKTEMLTQTFVLFTSKDQKIFLYHNEEKVFASPWQRRQS